MTITKNIPSDEEFNRRAAELQPHIFDGIDGRVKRRRQHRLTGAAIGVVLAAGLSVAAATLAPIANPDNGVGVVGPSGSSFAIDCYSTTDSAPTVLQYATQADANKVVADPAGACATAAKNLQIENAVGSQASALAAKGQNCGIITVPGQLSWTWKADSSGGMSTGQGAPPANWPSNCMTTSAIAAPAVPDLSRATCARASNWANVYPLAADSTPEAVCSAKGYQVWGQ
jgi:hypothetical protein